MTDTTPEMSATPPQPVAGSTGEGDGPLAVAPPVAPRPSAARTGLTNGVVPDLASLVARMRQLADDLDGPLLCTQPAYGMPGYAHCAACCYGTGIVITCDGEQAQADAADALRRAAAIIDRERASCTFPPLEVPAPLFAGGRTPTEVAKSAAERAS